MSSGECADGVKARPAWKNIYNPESTQSSRFQRMSTISAVKNDNALNWRSSPELLGKVNQRKAGVYEESDLRPREVIPAHKLQVLQNDQLNTRAIARRLTAFSSKRGHSALLFPVDKLKISPLGDTGKASSITVGNERTLDRTVRGDLPIWSAPVSHILEWEQSGSSRVSYFR